jgi:hypothetical protein
MLIANEVERISDKYKGTPNFRKLVALSLAKRELDLEKENQPSATTKLPRNSSVLGLDYDEGLFQ